MDRLSLRAAQKGEITTLGEWLPSATGGWGGAGRGGGGGGGGGGARCATGSNGTSIHGHGCVTRNSALLSTCAIHLCRKLSHLVILAPLHFAEPKEILDDSDEETLLILF